MSDTRIVDILLPKLETSVKATPDVVVQEMKPGVEDVATAFRNSSEAPDNILYHVTNEYSPDQGGLDPAESIDGVTWLKAYGPHSTGGNRVLAIDKTQLDHSLLYHDGRGNLCYKGKIPPSAILDLGRRPNFSLGESIHDLITKRIRELTASI